jgi:hypothetical protein
MGQVFRRALQCANGPILIFVLVLLFEEGRADELLALSNEVVLGYRRALVREVVATLLVVKGFNHRL